MACSIDSAYPRHSIIKSQALEGSSLESLHSQVIDELGRGLLDRFRFANQRSTLNGPSNRLDFQIVLESEAPPFTTIARLFVPAEWCGPVK